MWDYLWLGMIYIFSNTLYSILSYISPMYQPKYDTVSHTLSSIARSNEEFQLPGWAGDARTVGIFHPVMLARVINCALP